MPKVRFWAAAVAASVLASGAVPTLGLGAGAWAAEAWKAPRNAFGQPDFSGVWTNASLTQLERPAQFKTLEITPDQARVMETTGFARFRTADAQPSRSDEGAPSVARDPGGYNAFWMDPGTKVGNIGGSLRSSWLVEPADGRLPFSPAGRKLFLAEANRVQTNFDGPEARQVAERCLLGFGSTAGPPMLNVLYNNTYQIQQSKDALAIVVEMNHDARIIRLDSRAHLPGHIRQWMGDSVGWWEGDTLVVETTNFNSGEQLRPGIPTTIFISMDAKVTERFTRISERQIRYEFTVDDPAVYTQPWRGEMPLNATKGPVYEYACHEGNYALPGILRGARVAEAQGRKPEASGLGE